MRIGAGNRTNQAENEGNSRKGGEKAGTEQRKEGNAINVCWNPGTRVEIQGMQGVNGGNSGKQGGNARNGGKNAAN